MSEIDQGWMDRMTQWTRDIHSIVTRTASDVSRLDRRVEKMELYESMAKWAVPLLVVAAVSVIWSASKLDALVNRHSEQVSSLERAPEKLSKSISDLEQSVSRLSDYPKRVERLEDRLLRAERERSEAVPKSK